MLQIKFNNNNNNNNNNLYSDKSIHDTFTVDRTPLAYFVGVMSYQNIYLINILVQEKKQLIIKEIKKKIIDKARSTKRM